MAAISLLLALAALSLGPRKIGDAPVAVGAALHGSTGVVTRSVMGGRVDDTGLDDAADTDEGQHELDYFEATLSFRRRCEHGLNIRRTR